MVDLYVGSHAHSIQGQPARIDGRRCFTAAHPPPKHADPARMRILLDSGAFTDVMGSRRLDPEQALDRQLAWERRAGERWGAPVISHALVSYDRLIDEQELDGRRQKLRWSVADGELAVAETVEAAHYLAAQRERLAPRRLVLSAQGVEANQYARCVERILPAAGPDDWLGLGGWCLLGRWTSWLPEFWRTISRVLPMARDAGIRHAHLFGVLWLPALGCLLWLADRLGMTVSTDSSAPVRQCLGGDAVKSGRRRADWRENIAYWTALLAGLRQRPEYRPLPDQLSFLDTI